MLQLAAINPAVEMEMGQRGVCFCRIAVVTWLSS